MAMVGLAVAQLFGSRASPLNFPRYPDWCSVCCATLFLATMLQCVDDLISMERSSTIESARDAWLIFADLCGWDIPLEKSPLPSRLFRALGVFVNLTPYPVRPQPSRFARCESWGCSKQWQRSWPLADCRLDTQRAWSANSCLQRWPSPVSSANQCSGHYAVDATSSGPT